MEPFVGFNGRVEWKKNRWVAEVAESGLGDQGRNNMNLIPRICSKCMSVDPLAQALPHKQCQLELLRCKEKLVEALQKKHETGSWD
jgi:hypothetical protein